MSALRLFEAVGVELEYAIVDAESLAVRPIADRLLEAAAGRIASETLRGPLAWSNELALHQVELKTNGPAPGLAGLAGDFAAGVDEANALLAPMGARLIGDGLYGVDLKVVDGRALLIEVNDNPNLDAGCEDAVLKDDLYLAIMRHFRARLDARGGPGTAVP